MPVNCRDGQLGRDARAGTRGDEPGLVAGIDVGGTKTLAVVYRDPAPGVSAVYPYGEMVAPVTWPWRADDVVARVVCPTRAGSPERFVGFIDDVLTDVAGAAGVAPTGLVSAAVGLPGVLDRSTGRVRHAVNLGIGDDGVDIVRALESRIGRPAVAANDVNLAALGAAAALGLAGDVAFLSIGTGLALGLLLDGRTHQGATGSAGEIGHVPVVADGPVCTCGQRGCLETVVSGRAIARAWPTVPDASADASAGPGDEQAAFPGDPGHNGGGGAASALLRGAASGNRAAVAVRDRVFDHLAWAVTLIGQMVDPDVIVLGGGVADAGDPFLAEVKKALERRAARSPFVDALDLPSRVRIVPAGLDAGAVGAVTAARALRTGVAL
jgi:glucokinase